MWYTNPGDRTSPISTNSFGLASSIAIGGYVRLYGFTVYSSNLAAQFVLLFDASKLPADGLVPLIALPVAAANQVSGYYGAAGRVFQRGVVICNSTTATTKTLGAADCLFDVQYDNLPST